MEIVGSFLDEDWESLSQIFGENPADFLLHCDGFSTNLQIPSTSFSPSDPNCQIDQPLFLNIHRDIESINNPDHHVMDQQQLLLLKPQIHRASAHEFMLKRKSEDEDHNFSPPHENPKKKPRNAYKSRAAQSKKSKKTIQDEKKNVNEEEGINGGGGNSSSDDESNAKTRPTRGSATDSQSLYARKRRERINERLKILQNLVPNGTKVDISTMLEEAVHYVKFLQLQIKLLSSDNLWMYAPLAYNGMDIGIYQNISPDLRP